MVVLVATEMTHGSFAAPMMGPAARAVPELLSPTIATTPSRSIISLTFVTALSGTFSLSR